MKMQLSPNAWSCLPTSFAMVMDVPVEQVFAHIGHDGSQIIKEPALRRGFHVQECVDFALSRYHHPVLVERNPYMLLEETEEILELEFPQERWERYVQSVPGVLLGTTQEGGLHAVAWDMEKIFDPKGFKCNLQDFAAIAFLAFY